jgi:ABC-2 type transport system permease protein
MRNVMAIAERELRSYFASPMAYVIIGFFLLPFGVFFYLYLTLFVRNSMQMTQFGGAQNVNQQVIRYVLQNASVIILFIMPMITMRTYSEEKRSGTIELLLTSPVSDVEIILGKFFGALGLYLAMLLVTLLYIGILYWAAWPNPGPEWKPIVAAYLGLLLMGAAFISIGLLISSTTNNQIVAGVVTFVVFLLFWIVGWFADSAGPTIGPITSYMSITEHFDDFSKGVIDTRHVIYYLSLITFGLFLTAKSVDTERWRG